MIALSVYPRLHYSLSLSSSLSLSLLFFFDRFLSPYQFIIFDTILLNQLGVTFDWDSQTTKSSLLYFLYVRHWPYLILLFLPHFPTLFSLFPWDRDPKVDWDSVVV
jgi:hypothetical protein